MNDSLGANSGSREPDLASRPGPSGFDPARVRKMLWAVYMRIDTMPKSNLNMGLDIWTIRTLAMLREAIELIDAQPEHPINPVCKEGGNS